MKPLDSRRGMSPVTSRVLALGVPLAVAFVAQMAISFTDAALVARLGTAELAGVTLALSVSTVPMLVGLGLVTAVSPKIAESYRAKTPREVGTWFVQGAVLALAAGVLAIVVLLNTRNILLTVGQDRHLADIAQHYNVGAAAGMIFFFFYINARSAMSAVGSPKALTWIMVAAIPINVLVGFVAIFGIGKYDGWGVFGAGLGSSFVQALIVLATIIAIYRGEMMAILDLGVSHLRIDLHKLKELARLGIPIGLRILVAEGFLPILAFFVARYGTDATAAHAVGLRIETLIVVIALGFSTAASTVSAWARADGDWRALRDLRNSLLHIGFVYAAMVSTVVVVLFPFTAHSLFALQPSAESTLQKLLPLVIAFFFIDTYGLIFGGFLVGLLDTFLPAVAVAISYWLVGLGLGMVLAERTALGFYGLWIGMIVGGSTVVLFNLARSSHHIRILRASSAALARDDP